MKLKINAPIVVAEDDEDDRQMIREALIENGVSNEVHFVCDGEELMNFLECKEKYICRDKYDSPGLILLDLNMPKKDGHEALKEIKSSSALCHIPVVVLTTTNFDEDVVRTYAGGASSFVTKPIYFSDLVEVMRDLVHYWFEVVDLSKA